MKLKIYSVRKSKNSTIIITVKNILIMIIKIFAKKLAWTFSK